MQVFYDDELASLWDPYIQSLMDKNACIIALRGAGSYNGISRKSADRIVTQLILQIKNLSHDGDLALLFDGDNDSGKYPDIGYIMGRLRDHFDDRRRTHHIAVQREDWYKGDGEPIRNRTDYPDGKPYRTYVFPKGVFEGEHSRFTQSAALAAYHNYYQVYVGACGNIASEQLRDLNNKVPAGQSVYVMVYRCKVNPGQDEMIYGKIGAAEAEGNPNKAERLRGALVQRQNNPYGLMYTPDGARKPFWNELDRLKITEFDIE